MPFAILVVSGDRILQEEILTCLEQIEGCEMVIAATKTEALALSSSDGFSAVLIDASENDIPLVRFAHELVAEHGNLRLLVIPPANNPHHPVLKGWVFTSLLMRPLEVSALRTGLGLDPPEIDEDTGEALFLEDEWVTLDLPGEVDGARHDQEIDIPEWLEDVGSRINEIDLEGPASTAVDPQEVALAWERDNPDAIPPPLPLTGEFPEEVSESSAFENQDLPVDLHTAVTTRLDPGMAELATENTAPTSPPEADSSEEDKGIPVEATPQPSHEIAEPSIAHQGSYSLEPAPVPGTEPMGIQGVRLKYYVVLIPKQPDHFLTGELSGRVGFILPQIHLTLGWKLTGISVRPSHLLWQFSLPANVHPAEAVSQIRRKTSTHIFTNFPKLAAENLTNDFWAAGYLILSGEKPPSLPTIREFIQRTRQQF